MSDDLQKLTVDLERAGGRADVDARKAVQVEAFKMKAEWRQIVTGARNLGGLASAVTYDTRLIPSGAEAEVGYEQRGQGELGNIAEFGTSTQGPKRPAGAAVLKAGADRLEKYLGGLDPL